MAMAQAPLLTLIFHGSFGAYWKDGLDWNCQLPSDLQLLSPPQFITIQNVSAPKAIAASNGVGPSI